MSLVDVAPVLSAGASAAYIIYRAHRGKSPMPDFTLLTAKGRAAAIVRRAEETRTAAEVARREAAEAVALAHQEDLIARTKRHDEDVIEHQRSILAWAEQVVEVLLDVPVQAWTADDCDTVAGWAKRHLDTRGWILSVNVPPIREHLLSVVNDLVAEWSVADADAKRYEQSPKDSARVWRESRDAKQRQTTVQETIAYLRGLRVLNPTCQHASANALHRASPVRGYVCDRCDVKAIGSGSSVVVPLLSAAPPPPPTVGDVIDEAKAAEARREYQRRVEEDRRRSQTLAQLKSSIRAKQEAEALAKARQANLAKRYPSGKRQPTTPMSTEALRAMAASLRAHQAEINPLPVEVNDPDTGEHLGWVRKTPEGWKVAEIPKATFYETHEVHNGFGEVIGTYRTPITDEETA